MPFALEVLTLGFILSADSFSAAVAMGSRKFSSKDALKFATASGGAEALSTLIGYFAGAKIVSLISAYDHWIAFTLLAGVALHMIVEGIQGLRGQLEEASSEEFHSVGKILLVSFATSLDAFGVGIGLGLAERPLWPFVTSIGLWAFATTLLGLCVGRGLSKKFGPIFTILAGLVLGYLSIQMLSI